jgi:hypothetical protein
MSGTPVAAVKLERRDPWRRLREKPGVTVKSTARRRPR